jgi:hypothetical protein
LSLQIKEEGEDSAKRDLWLIWASGCLICEDKKKKYIYIVTYILRKF